MNVAVKEPVYIIIPVHNRKQITLKCLENLDKSGDLQQYHVVVVDDGSTDGTTEAINSSYPDVTVLTGDGNLWWTGAIKKGMEYAYEQGAEYFIWLNDDCLVTEQAIPDLVTFCRQSSLNIIGCQGYELDNPNQIAFGGRIRDWQGYHLVKFPENKISQCDVLNGNLVCFSKKLIDTIGYPNYKKCPHYGGDTLFSIRARKAGFKLFVDGRHKIYNLYGKSKMFPQRWLFQEGKPTEIIKLLFTPYSLISWQMWITLNLAEYGKVMGLINFITNYIAKYFIPVFFITILRFFPLSIRYKVSQFKQILVSNY